MNKKIVIGLIALLIVGAVAVRLITNNEKSNSTPIPAVGTAEEQATMHEFFPNVPESNRFSIETADQIMDRFDSGTGIIFLGFKECPWCQKMAPILNEAAEAGGANIYYIDIRKLNQETPDEYQALISYLVPYLPKDANGSVRISTPDISFVRNGEIIWRYEMDAVSDAERTPDEYWTEARKERALKQFDKQIKEMRKET